MSSEVFDTRKNIFNMKGQGSLNKVHEPSTKHTADADSDTLKRRRCQSGFHRKRRGVLYIICHSLPIVQMKMKHFPLKRSEHGYVHMKSIVQFYLRIMFYYCFLIQRLLFQKHQPSYRRNVRSSIFVTMPFKLSSSSHGRS